MASLPFSRQAAAAGCVLLTLLVQGIPEALSAQESAPDRWKIFADVGLDASGGNNELTVLRTGFGVTFLESRDLEFDLSGSYRYSERSGEVFERQLRGAFKLDLYPNDVWSPFAYLNGFRDPLRRRLDLRAEGGAGVKYTWGQWEGGKASMSLAGTYTAEHYTKVEGLETPPDRREGRVSWRHKLDQTFRGENTLEQIVFYQPVWDGWGDYVFTARHSVKAMLVGSLSLVLTHEFIHDETPVESVKKDDWTLGVSLRYEF